MKCPILSLMYIFRHAPQNSTLRPVETEARLRVQPRLARLI